MESLPLNNAPDSAALPPTGIAERARTGREANTSGNLGSEFGYPSGDLAAFELEKRPNHGGMSALEGLHPHSV